MKVLSSLSQYILLGIITLFILSCSNTPKSLSAVPKEATVVASINLYSLGEKANLKKAKELKIFKKFQDEVKSENKKLEKIFSEFIENYKVSGIDIKKDIFIYRYSQFSDETHQDYIGVSAQVRDKGKFTDFAKRIAEATETNVTIENAKDYSFFFTQKELVGWDEDKILLLSAVEQNDRLEEIFAKLFHLDKKEQISSNKDFKDFYDKKEEISVWVSGRLIEDLGSDTDTSLDEVRNMSDLDIRSSSLSFYLDFADENITLTTALNANEEFKKKLEKYKFWKNKFNAELLNFLPKESYLAGSFSINMPLYYKYLKEQSIFTLMESVFLMGTGTKLEDFFNTLGGSAIFTISGFERKSYTHKVYEEFDLDTDEDDNEDSNIAISGEDNQEEDLYEDHYVEKTEEILTPLVSFVMDIKNKEFIERQLKKSYSRLLKKENGYYTLTKDDITIYIAYNEKYLFISNDKSGVDAFLKKGYDKDRSLAKATIAQQIMKNNFYGYVNLDYDTYPQIVKDEIKKEQNRQEQYLLSIWKDILKDMEVKQRGDYATQFILNLRNTEQNSLYTLLKMIDKSIE
jgi:hypothetical protein